MNIIQKLFDKKLRENRKRIYLEGVAERLINVSMEGGDVWLVVNSIPIAPISAITGKTDIRECADFVSKIRGFYVQRNL
jgi:hypothetical protein